MYGSNPYQCRCGGYGGKSQGNSFTLIVILFILLIIVGAAIYC
ncbi:YjcZ family sporulation protein [Halobacillus shinanisalinarum]|uniref:YjcZ family sporulation protein n=1 Tax=Halobacillus shinanisalinarum TaxID=2932258 RepID=A0ABY4GY18_9BACI|nr:YjcZ family sporulation protein [Halobacillus shinanisalinarum]UOQ92993.1 YjcZ family sporulation protein [Halobacillus shinanisalinarum]